MNSNIRIWGIALMISLMLNAFALGMIISDKMSALSLNRGQSLIGPAPQLPMQHRLPPQARMLFRDLGETNHDEIKKQFKAIHEARLAVKAELEKDALDTGALETKLSELRAAEGDAASNAHKVLIKVASGLSKEERQALADMIMFSAPGFPAGPGMKMRFAPRLPPP